MSAYYNEHDSKAAAWLRQLITDGHIAAGDVDERSICDVRGDELRGYTQCHFFAGIGGWSLALRLAGWPDSEPVWTGSCPCQPFNQAGKRRGTKDPRHLWPQFRDLIAHAAPAVVFGEQVASKAGRGWLAGIRADLEALAYAVGAADLCAAGAGAPNIRQRLWWVADASGGQREQCLWSQGNELQQSSDHIPARGLADASDAERTRRSEEGQRSAHVFYAANGGITGGLGDTDCAGLGEQCGSVSISAEQSAAQLRGHARNFWSAFDLIPCLDGKARRIEPGTFPLAHGVPHHVGLLRGYGNAINPWIAAEFIAAYVETRNQEPSTLNIET